MNISDLRANIFINSFISAFILQLSFIFRITLGLIDKLTNISGKVLKNFFTNIFQVVATDIRELGLNNVLGIKNKID